MKLGDMLAEKIGRENISKNSNLYKALSKSGVPRGLEFKRIERLPRRNWEDADDLKSLTQLLTKALRKPWGEMELWPIQAAALREIHDWKGCLGPIAVGQGKALISLLAPTVAGVQKAVLLVPASLRDQTNEHVLPHLRMHWKMRPEPILIGYEELSLEKNAELLWEIQPEMIIADEAHYLKNLNSGRGRRVRRYMSEFPKTIFVALSGTMTRRSLRDYWHLTLWALKEDLSPLPTKWTDLQQWADVLDEGVEEEKRPDPGAMILFCEGEENVRQGFRRRFVETPGVVASPEDQLGVSLRIDKRPVDVPFEVSAAITNLESKWAAPGGEEIAEAAEIARHAKELACGFYYVWDPPPPKEWMEARQEWKAYVRETIRHNRRGLDTELQVWNECNRALKETNKKVDTSKYIKWAGIKDSFKPNSIPIWISDFLVKEIIKWLNETGGIAWIEHRALGEALEAAGVKYYGSGEKASREIQHAEGPIAASARAHGTGKNLQKWNKNLITSASSSGQTWEQIIGRTHRPGQEADEVLVDVFLHTQRLNEAFRQAIADAHYFKDTTGAPRKLLYADILFPV